MSAARLAFQDVVMCGAKSACASATRVKARALRAEAALGRAKAQRRQRSAGAAC